MYDEYMRHSIVFNSPLSVYYPGQRGCTVTDQCALKVVETKCDAGYCMCPSHKLIHNGKCVGYCPDGYVITGFFLLAVTLFFTSLL